jgi:steroid delta-isomerase-like uncharacterized protein
MAVDDNKEALNRVYAAMNAHDRAALATLIAPQFVHPNFPDARGPEGFVQAFGMVLAAFPDFGLTIADMIAEGDKVAARGSFTGTHRGDFMGIPATGKAIDVAIMEIWRFANGKAVESWVQMDALGMLQQLGVVPMPEQAT